MKPRIVSGLSVNLGTIIVILIFTTTFVVPRIFAQSTTLPPVNVYLFHSDLCPHCEKERDFFRRYQEVNAERYQLYEFQVHANQTNLELFEQVESYLQTGATTVPYLVIGDEAIIGFLSDSTTGKQINAQILRCYLDGCPDEVGKILAISPQPTIKARVSQALTLTVTPVVSMAETTPTDPHSPSPTPTPLAEEPELLVDVPFLGEVDLSEYSLLAVTIILGFLDGFNPCAMWVLLFLISLLLGMEASMKRWVLGITFIIASGVVYFVFLTAWLNAFMFLGFVTWIRICIGLVAIGSGLLSLRKYFRDKGGCEVVDDDRRRSLLSRMQQITKSSNFWLAFIGIIGLAFSVNLIELLCSAGLPAIFTHVLSISSLPTSTYYLYLLLYIGVFIIDDLMIFIVAMVTLQATGISVKYTRWLHLIGGVVILLIGFLLIFKPELLMLS